MSLDIHCIDKRRQRAIHTFSLSDYAHRDIANRLLERLDLIRLIPKEIIVYGWQTQIVITLLRGRYPDAHMRAIDHIEGLNALPTSSVDLVISHWALDWENKPKQVLQAFHRLLSHESLLTFSTLGPDTAQECRQSFSVVDDYPHVHTFTDMHHIGDALKQLGFDDPVVDMEMVTLAYDDLSLLCRDLKNTASTNANVDRKRGLMTPLQWQCMCAHYETLKIDGCYPFTLEVIYGHAWKVERSTQMPKEVTIPVSAIRK